jgi:hypothetical protein
VLIAITGWGQEGDKHRSKEARFDHHLVKPVDPAMLMELLASLEKVPPLADRLPADHRFDRPGRKSTSTASACATVP